MDNRPGETVVKDSSTGANKWTQRQRGGQPQTEPTPIVCWDSEDNAGQRRDICEPTRSHPSDAAALIPNTISPPNT